MSPREFGTCSVKVAESMIFSILHSTHACQKKSKVKLEKKDNGDSLRNYVLSSYKLYIIHRKTSASEALFNKAAGLQSATLIKK